MKLNDWQILTLTALVAIGLVLGGPGCSEQDATGHAASEDHSGHNHGASSQAADDLVDGHADDWCAEHQIAESECPFCNPALIESLGWCAGHQVPEALCYQCNPNLVAAFKAVGDWCAGHERPESQCSLCNPWLVPDNAGARGDRTAGSTDSGAGSSVALGEHLSNQSVPRTQRRPSVACTKQNLTVTFARPEIVQEVGLEFGTVQMLPITRTLECNAVVAYDGNRFAQLAPQVPGIVTTVERDLGDRVEPGDVLATITSPAFGAAKATYLQAQAAVGLWQKNHERETDLLTRGVSTERDVLEAETRLAETRIALSRAEQELLGLGLSPQQIAQVGRSADTTARYQVTASFSGVIVERQAAVGEVFDPSQPLFAVADISRMWALLDVYETDVREIREGQPVVLHVEGLPGDPFAGTITWVSSQMDPRTRTLQARAELDNHRGLLRANMFARAVVAVKDQQQTLVVPREAVQWEGCCNVVFVKQSETIYKPRKVYLGPPAGSVYEVIGGLEPGEIVVTQGSFLLKTEILKSNIGAGCCEVQPGT
jgi:cobalt-zinc-cadmium efflux system membrane fusion protein